MVAKAVEILYFALQIFSVVALSALTYTLLFGLKQPGTSRPNPLVPANTILYIASGIISSLLLFTDHLHGSPPPRPLCEAQSAFMLAFPPSLAGLALSLVLTVWRLAWHVHSDRSPWISQTYFTVLLIAFPFFTFTAFVTAGAIVGAHSTVARRDFYCLTDNGPIQTASAAVSAVLLFTTCIFQLWTVFIVVRRYRISRKLGREEIGTDVPLAIRVLSFGIFVFVALILSFVAAVNYSLVVPDILVACFGPVIFFIFASQDEVLRAWRLKPPRQRTQDRSDSIVTLDSARRQQSRRRDDSFNTTAMPASMMADLNAYRFPAPTTATPAAAAAAQSAASVQSAPSTAPSTATSTATSTAPLSAVPPLALALPAAPLPPLSPPSPPPLSASPPLPAPHLASPPLCPQVSALPLASASTEQQ